MQEVAKKEKENTKARIANARGKCYVLTFGYFGKFEPMTTDFAGARAN